MLLVDLSSLSCWISTTARDPAPRSPYPARFPRRPGLLRLGMAAARSKSCIWGRRAPPPRLRVSSGTAEARARELMDAHGNCRAQRPPPPVRLRRCTIFRLEARAPANPTMLWLKARDPASCGWSGPVVRDDCWPSASALHAAR